MVPFQITDSIKKWSILKSPVGLLIRSLSLPEMGKTVLMLVCLHFKTIKWLKNNMEVKCQLNWVHLRGHRSQSAVWMLRATCGCLSVSLRRTMCCGSWIRPCSHFGSRRSGSHASLSHDVFPPLGSHSAPHLQRGTPLNNKCRYVSWRKYDFHWRS